MKNDLKRLWRLGDGYLYLVDCYLIDRSLAGRYQKRWRFGKEAPALRRLLAGHHFTDGVFGPQGLAVGRFAVFMPVV